MRNPLLLCALLVGVIVAPALASAPSLRVEGTTNLTPLLAKAASTFSAADGATVRVAGTSSGAGIAALRSGTIDVAASDVAVDDPAFEGTTLGTVGFAFVANPAAHVKNLTRAQLQSIFAGKITNWKRVGGADCAIVIISREIGTGTRLVLEQKVAKTLIPTRSVSNADAVMQAVAQTRGAIGYVASYFVGKRADLVVSYDGVMPTPATFKNRTYAFETDEHLYVRTDASASARAFVSAVARNRALLLSFGIY